MVLLVNFLVNNFSMIKDTSLTYVKSLHGYHGYLNKIFVIDDLNILNKNMSGLPNSP